MKSAFRVFGILLFVTWVASAGAADSVHATRGNTPVLQGGVVAQAKAGGDSVLVMGPWSSGAAYNGQFQTPSGEPAWNGWTHADLSINEEKNWRVSDYNAAGLNGHAAGNLAAWCGSPDFPLCDNADAIGGYGNNWDEILEWSGTVADPDQPCTVGIDAFLNIDTEPAYDYLYLEYESAASGVVEVMAWDGHHEDLHLQTGFTLQPGDYTGEGGDQVVVRLHFRSDGGWSDEDCDYWTIGACQVDDLSVTLGNGSLTYFHDFEDGTLGQWVQNDRIGVGDFAHLENRLRELDDCRENTSVQVCWVDDGDVVPGTGGSECINWCYGPGGYVLNSTGGLLGDGYYLDNQLLSPVMAWPEGKTGGDFTAEIYWHEFADYDSPFMVFDWSVRSTASADPADIENADWDGTNFYYFPSGPYYMQIGGAIGDYLEPGARWVQVSYRITEMGWAWGYNGHDATPAPYFDNARVMAYDIGGPSLSAYSEELANDGFPASGELDPQDPGACSVRFDMARNVGYQIEGRIDPGDSVVIRARPGVPGSSLAGPPAMHYRLEANPLFDGYRTAGLPNRGTVAGTAIFGYTDRFSYDLPDEGFLFPGDVLHYYFRAEDNLGGVSLMPADTTGFSVPSMSADPLGYEPRFVMRALPTVTAIDAGGMTVPSLLMWDDAFDEQGQDEWAHALNTLGLFAGEHFDLYRTVDSYGQQGNGLGGRATLEQIAGYEHILVSCGTKDTGTLGDGGTDPLSDPGQDVQLLDAWLRLGDRELLLTGNHVASELTWSDAGAAFLDQWLGVQWLDWSWGADGIVGLDPVVAVNDPDPVFVQAQGWGVDDGCAGRITFDEVLPTGTAVAAASWVDAQGIPIAGAAPAVVNEHAATGSRTVFLPYDLSRILTLPTSAKANQPASLPARAIALIDILAYFGAPIGGDATPSRVPAGPLSVSNHPNPFNPVTRIAFDLPRAAHLSLRIYDVKGRLVETLIDEMRPAGPGVAVWTGTDHRGEPAASGVYFYRLQAADQTRFGKMMLAK